MYVTVQSQRIIRSCHAINDIIHCYDITNILIDFAVFQSKWNLLTRHSRRQTLHYCTYEYDDAFRLNVATHKLPSVSPPSSTECTFRLLLSTLVKPNNYSGHCHLISIIT